MTGLKPTPERIRGVMRKMAKGYKALDEIQSAARNRYGIDADAERLLETLREIYRDGKLQHIRTHSGEDHFRLDEDLKSLSWQSKTDNAVMFFDDRIKSFRRKSILVAWLNYRKGGFSVKVVSESFRLTRPVPKSIRGFGKAIDWVLRHGEWVTSK